MPIYTQCADCVFSKQKWSIVKGNFLPGLKKLMQTSFKGGKGFGERGGGGGGDNMQGG